MAKWFSDTDLADRMEFAVGLAITRNRVSRGQLGLSEVLSEVSGFPIKQAAVSRWLSKEAPTRPSLEHIVALARLAGIDPGWLALGDLTTAAPPDSWMPSRGTVMLRVAEETGPDYLSDEELDELPEERAAAHPDAPTRSRASFRKVKPEPKATPKRKRGRS